MIEHLSNFPDDVLAFVCTGRVTMADYDSVLVPAVVKALEKQKKIRLYYETSADFSGIDPGAMWGSGHESAFYAPFARTNGELMRPESNSRFVAV